MRTFSSFVYMNNLLAQCPDENKVILGVYTRLFKPSVKIVEENCGTRIGSRRPVNNKVVGSLEIANSDTPIISTRVTSLLQNKATFTFVRGVESCRSEGGICRKCLHGSYEYIDPTFDKTLITSTSQYPALSTVPAVGSSISMDFTGSNSVPFLTYLSNSYSGNILGLKSYLTNPLPLPEKLLRSYIPDGVLALFLREIEDTKLVSVLEMNYAKDVNNKLEKVLFLLSMYFIGYYTKK